MKWPRRMVIIIGSVAVLTPVAFIFGGPSPLGQSRRPEQPPTRVERLAEARENPGLGISLEPPPRSYEPPISGEEAAATAWNEEWQPGVSELTAQLVLFSGEKFQGLDRRPLWLVKLHDACVPIMGPAGAGDDPGDCASTVSNVAIDAVTGEFRFGYASGPKTLGGSPAPGG